MFKEVLFTTRWHYLYFNYISARWTRDLHRSTLYKNVTVFIFQLYISRMNTGRSQKYSLQQGDCILISIIRQQDEHVTFTEVRLTTMLQYLYFNYISAGLTRDVHISTLYNKVTVFIFQLYISRMNTWLSHKYSLQQCDSIYISIIYQQDEHVTFRQVLFTARWQYLYFNYISAGWTRDVYTSTLYNKVTVFIFQLYISKINTWLAQKCSL